MADENFTLVSVLDPGIDTERMTGKQMVDYIESRELSKIEPYFKPGAYVTKFHCREVPHALWARFVMATSVEAERFERAFQAGVMAVENAPQRDGSFVPQVENLPRSHEVMIDDAAARFSPAERSEIGMVIWRRSFLAPRTALPYQLPPTVHSCVAARDYLPAAPSQSAQATGSASASSASGATQETPSTTASTAETCGADSAPATDATATVKTSEAGA